MKQIEATHASACLGCGSGIDKGETFWWAPSEAFCLDCGPPSPGQPAGATTTDEDVPGYVLQLRKRIDNLQAQVDQLGIAVTTIKQSAEIHNKILIAMAKWIEKLSTDLGIESPDLPE